MQGNLATVNSLGCNAQLANSLIHNLSNFLYSQKYFTSAQENYVRSNTEELSAANFLNDSAWVIECLQDMQFHAHFFNSSDVLCSLRRILFFADEGVVLSFIDPENNIHEEFISEGPSFLECRFDGKIVHRFRAGTSNGRLFAYSFHYKDFSANTETLGKQTIIFEGIVPPVCNTFVLRDNIV